MPKHNNKFIYTISFILLVGGIISLLILNLKGTNVYFLTVSEACSKEIKKGTRLRIFGQVKEIEKNIDTIKFKLVDKKIPKSWIWVKYNGFVPDTFRIGADVIIEGSFRDHIFFAQKLMTKCPSKYRSK